MTHPRVRSGWARRVAGGAVALLLMVVLPVVAPTESASGGGSYPTLLSVGEDGSNVIGATPMASSDGNFVVFVSDSRDLPNDEEGPTGGINQVWLLDRSDGQVYPVSLDTTGGYANSHATLPSISADGRYVAFESAATDLHASDTSADKDIFVVDMNVLDSPAVSLLTDDDGTNPFGGASNEDDTQPSISADGSRVVFTTKSQLVEEDVTSFPQSSFDVYVRERAGSGVWFASVSPTGGDIVGATAPRRAISGDGQFVVFLSGSGNGAYVYRVGDPNSEDLLVTDEDGPTFRPHGGPVISETGVIAYSTKIPGGGNGVRGVAMTTVHSFPDAHEVLVVCADDSDGYLAGTTEATDSNFGSFALNAAGTRLAFNTSSAEVCINGSVTQVSGHDVFTLDWGGPEQVSLKHDGTSSANGESEYPDVAGDGSEVIFQSRANDLMPSGDSSNDVDIYGWGIGPVPPGEDVDGGTPPFTAFGGDPVNVVTGGFVHNRVDFELGSPHRLALSRFYNSTDNDDYGFGRGWSHTFSMTAQANEPVDPSTSDVRVRDDRGQELRFAYNAGGSVWDRPPGFLADLSHNAGGSGTADDFYTLTWADGRTWVFQPDGRVDRIDYPDGESVEVTWDTTGELLHATDSATGATMVLVDAENSGAGNDQVEAVTNTADDRVVAYGYNGSDADLEWVSEPGDASGGGIVEFYETDHPLGLVTAIKNGTVDADRNNTAESAGELVIENVYAPGGRVEQQTTATGETVTFSYGALVAQSPNLWETTIVFDPEGDFEETVRYQYNDAGEVTGIIDPTPELGEVDRTFSTETGNVGQPELLTDRRDAETFNDYDGEGRLIARIQPDPATGSYQGQNATSETFDYVGSGDPRLEVHVNQAGEKTSYHYSGASQIPTEIRQCTGGTSSQTCATGAGTITTTITPESDADLVGLVAAVADPDGVTTSYDNDDPSDGIDCGARRLCSVTVENGAGTGDDAVTEYSYDALTGQVASITEYNDPSTSDDDALTTFTYDPAGRLTEQIGPLANADYAPDSDYDTYFPTEYGYDAAGRLHWVSDDANPDTLGPDGASVVYAYLPDGSISTETKLVGALEPGGSSTTVTTKYRYNTAGRLTSVSEADDGDSYFGAGVEGESPDGTDNKLTESTTLFSYTELGRLESQADAVGIVSWFCYDLDGNLTHSLTQTSAPTCSSLGDPNGSAQHSRTTYDLLGRVTSEINAEGETTTYDYDALGRVATLTEADGSGVERTTTNTYDGFGRLVAVSGQRGDFWNDVTEKRVYTPGGRLDAVCTPPADIYQSSHGFSWDGTCDGSGERLTDYVWTAGRLTRVTEPNGDKTDYTHDPAGRVLTETAGATTADAATTTYGYDVAGQRTSVMRPAGNGNDVNAETTFGPRGVLEETDFHDGGTPASRAFSYNQAGWLLSATDANDVTVEYEYDVRGNRRFRYSDLDGSTPATEQWQYDAADRLTKAIDPLTEETTYSFGTTTGTDYGRLTSVADASGRTRTLGYDYAGRVTSESWAASGLTTTSLSSAYDDLGRVTSRTRTGTGETGAVSYTYNPDDTISEVDGPKSGGSFDADRILYEWSITGTPAAMTYPNGAILEYEHDDRDRIVNTFLDSGGTPLPIGEYTYDARGNMETESLDDGDVAVRTYAYQADAPKPTYYEQDFITISGEDTATKIGYRDDGRIGSVCAFDDPASTTETTACDDEGDDVLSEYGYDPAGQLESVTVDDILTTDVTYNRSGMRDTYTAFDPATGDELTRDSYSFDEAGQLNEVDREEWTGSAWDTPYTLAAYDYDDSGRRLELEDDSAATIWAYTYNTKGEITERTDGTASETYAYNAAGEMTSTTQGSTVNSMVWDPATSGISRIVSYHYSPWNLTWNSAYGLRGLYVSVWSWWGALDHLGSNTGAAGYPAIEANYDDWGNRDLQANGPGYRGEFQLPDRIHLRNRDYDPTTATFLTRDMLDGQDGSPDVANPYDYVGNDPVNFTDPLGLARQDDRPYAPQGACGPLPPPNPEQPTPGSIPHPAIAPIACPAIPSTPKCDFYHVNGKVPIWVENYKDLPPSALAWKVQRELCAGHDVQIHRYVPVQGGNFAVNTMSGEFFMDGWNEIESARSAGVLPRDNEESNFIEGFVLRFAANAATSGAASAVAMGAACSYAAVVCFIGILGAGTAAHAAINWRLTGDPDLYSALADATLATGTGAVCGAFLKASCLRAFAPPNPPAGGFVLSARARQVAALWTASLIVKLSAG